MEQPSRQDSSDNLYYSYNISTTDFLDLASAQEESSSFSQKNFVMGLLGNFASLFVFTFKIGLILSWDLLRFALAYVLFLKQKILSFVVFLDVSKDNAVRFMMWKRGILFRPATHGGFIALGALAVVAGGIFTRAEIAAQDLTSENLISAPNVPETIVPLGRPRSEVVTYSVKEGDTISTVAEKFGISVDTIKWANNKEDDALTVGQNLTIPPVTGIVYTVAATDTIQTVAAKYSADPQTIADYPFNYIDASLTLKAGQTLIIPNGSIPKPVAPKVAPRAPRSAPPSLAGGSGLLGWPVGCRSISQYASWYHQAIDLDCDYGTPVYASDPGRVIVSQKLAYDYGWHIVVDHGNGMTTLYAHLSALYVKVGDNVGRGQAIGAVGSTGRSTGPHLHYEVRRGDVQINPMSVL